MSISDDTSSRPPDASHAGPADPTVGHAGGGTPPVAGGLKASIQSRYGGRARLISGETPSTGCCSSDTSCCGDTAGGVNAFSQGIYGVEDMHGVELQAELVSLGCGNPLALCELREGETVLDLGSGGGLDVLVSARRVGPTGWAYGVDMTDEMLTLAWKNAVDADIGNVTFLKGDIEHIPAPDASVDVVISNCVINLALDKAAVLAEIGRVLRPGGRLAIADVVIEGGIDDLPFADDLRRDQHAWGSCVAGALSDREFRDVLRDVGFTDVDIQVTRRHTAEELFARGVPDWAQTVPRAQFDAGMARFTSSFVRASLA